MGGGPLAEDFYRPTWAADHSLRISTCQSWAAARAQHPGGGRSTPPWAAARAHQAPTGTRRTVGRHPLGHRPIARPPRAAWQQPQQRGAQGAARQKPLGGLRAAPARGGRTGGATPPSSTCGAAHHRVGDANDDLRHPISTGVRVVKSERSEAEGRGFESDPRSFSLHTPMAQRPTAGAPHCADSERVGAQWEGAPSHRRALGGRARWGPAHSAGAQRDAAQSAARHGAAPSWP